MTALWLVATWQALTTEGGVWVAALISVGGTALTTYLTYRSTQHKTTTDLTISERQNLLETAEKLRQGLVERIEQLEGSEARLIAEIDYLKDRMNWQEDVNAALRRSLRGLGVVVADIDLPPFPRRREEDG